MKEVYKPILRYEGYYEVSNLGNVRGVDRYVNHPKGGKLFLRGKPKSMSLNTNGYSKVMLNKNNKMENQNIHVLVAESFLGHVRRGREIVVDHIDNNKENNYVSNLQMITHRENLCKDKKGGSSKYTGVSWSNDSNKWRSTISMEGNNVNLGFYCKEIDAHYAYESMLHSLFKLKKKN